MPKTVTQTIKDIVVEDIKNVSIEGQMDDPATLKVYAFARLVDDATGDPAGTLSFEVTPNAGALTALSNILKGDIVTAANVALQARGEAGIKIPS